MKTRLKQARLNPHRNVRVPLARSAPVIKRMRTVV